MGNTSWRVACAPCGFHRFQYADGESPRQLDRDGATEDWIRAERRIDVHMFLGTIDFFCAHEV